MLNKRDSYPPNAYRSGCAFSGAPMRPGEEYVVELPIGYVAQRRADGTYIPDRMVCLSIDACHQVGATVGMVTAEKHAEVVAERDDLADQLALVKAELAQAREELDAVRSSLAAQLVDTVRRHLEVTTPASETEPRTVNNTEAKKRARRTS